MGKISNFFLQNKKWLPLILVAVLFFVLVPLHYANAAWWNVIGNIWDYIQTLPLKIIVAIIGIVLAIVILVLGFCYFLIVGLLTWIITVAINVGITPGGLNSTPQAITDAWSFTKDFVSLFFILILVFVGLATVLRIREYEMKKLIVPLVVMIILINFTGVIVGLIVDIGNIITSFFFPPGFTIANLANVWNDAWTYLMQTFQDTFLNFSDIQTQLADMVGIVASGVIYILYYIFAILIYFVVMLIFIVRVLILWLLMILAPVAFACYILPATRKLWSQWWQQLIQWTIIGAPIGFFLMISERMKSISVFGNVPANSISNIDPSVTTSFANLLSALLAPTMAIFFLAIGVMLSMTFVPQGASGVINFGKKAGMAAGKWAGRTARQSKPIAATEGAIRKRMENIPVVNRMPGFKQGSWETAKAKRVDDTKKQFATRQDTKEGNTAVWNSINQKFKTDSDIMAGLHLLAERKAFKDVANTPAEQAKLKALLERTRDKGLNKKTIYKANPELAEHLDLDYYDKTTGKTRKALNKKEAVEVAVSKLDPNDLKTLSKESLQDADVVSQIMQDKRRILQLGRILEKEKKEEMKKTIMAVRRSHGKGLTKQERKNFKESDMEMKKDINWS